jgi:exodeoxyribonuclease I
MAYVFYDTETTGTATDFDQILQFAALELDDDFNEVSSINLRCRILPYVVPSPTALCVTRVRPTDLLSPNRSHLDMICEIHSWILERSPCTMMGHNSIKFDENMLRQALYKTLHPVYLTNTGGNCRGDTMRIAQAASIFSPGTIEVPLSAKGRPAFKLGDLVRANGIDFSNNNAHDALADVRATVELARLLQDRAPAIWAQMRRNATKADALEFMTSKAAFCAAEVNFGTASSWLVTAVAKNPNYDAEMAVFDLAYDPRDYLNLEVAELVELMNGRQKVIRVVKANAQPMIVDTVVGRSLVKAAPYATETLKQHVILIREAKEFRERVAQALTMRFEDGDASDYVEQRIYEGFPSRPDERLMTDFHNASWEDRHAICGRFADERLAEIGLKLIFAEQPNVLPADVRRSIEEQFQKRLAADGAVPWMTISKAKTDLATLKVGGEEDPDHLLEIEAFLEGLQLRYGKLETLFDYATL